jgi:hypothetical protein
MTGHFALFASFVCPNVYSSLTQAARLLADPDEDGWERTDFPVVCEDCLGPNPYIRMQKVHTPTSQPTRPSSFQLPLFLSGHPVNSHVPPAPCAHPPLYPHNIPASLLTPFLLTLCIFSLPSQENYGAECAISARPFTVFRWRPGNEARYKRTVVCREIALAKNVCQVCLLDLDYGIPVQARDAALGREREAGQPPPSTTGHHDQTTSHHDQTTNWDYLQSPTNRNKPHTSQRGLPSIVFHTPGVPSL